MVRRSRQSGHTDRRKSKMCKKKERPNCRPKFKRESTEATNTTHADRITTLEEKTCIQQTETKNKSTTSWKTQYINGNGHVTPLPPRGAKPGTINRKRGRENVVKKDTTHTIKSEWYRKRERHKLQQCHICEQKETDKENMLLSCAYCNNNTHENCDDRAITDEQKPETHINAHIAK